MCYISVLSLHACEPNVGRTEVHLHKVRGVCFEEVVRCDGPSRPHDPRREREFRCVGPQKLTLSTLRDLYSGTMIMRKKLIEKEHKFCK